MSDPLKTQVGGDHYSRLKIQPMEFSLANNWDAAAHTALKYITRFRDKAGKADLEKAIHCIEMRKVLHPARPRIDQLAHYLLHASDPHAFLQQRSAARLRSLPDVHMSAYIKANGISGLQALALYALQDAVNHGTGEYHDEAVEAARQLMTAEYPDG